MKSLMLSVLVVLALSLGASAETRRPETAKKQALDQALEAFCGTWEIVTVQPQGSTKDATRLVFNKDGTYAAQDARGKELWTGTFDLDPMATPKIWDHRSHEAQRQGGDALGIYELDGDRLKVCCVVGNWKDKQWTDKPRPQEFKLPAADVVLDLRRMKTN